MKTIEVPTVGEPETEPLTDWQLEMVRTGLMIASQGATKAMARELLKFRGKMDSV